MDLKNINRVYFIGIGGIGMSALARYFKLMGKQVAGYDKTPSELTEKLINEGMQVFYDESENVIPEEFFQKEDTLVVLTPAIPAAHKGWNCFLDKGFRIYKRSEILGIIAKNSFTIAVAGTHGKTTTSSLIAHLLKSSGKNVSAFLGGITQNYQTNFILGQPTAADHLLVVEADEYDRSFLTLYPDIAIVTSMDADHLDIYGDNNEMQKSYLEFISQIKPGGYLVYKQGLPVKMNVDVKSFSYSRISTTADVFSGPHQVNNGTYQFDIHQQGKHSVNTKFGIPGLHNVENALAAFVACSICGVSDLQLAEGLASFKGVRRRFEYHVKNNKHIMIDDYAHHPEEIRAFLSSVRDLYPDKKITAVFQPHLYTRTRDFLDEFADSLNLADHLFLLEIYPAREQPLPGINSRLLLDKISNHSKELVTKESLIHRVKTLKPELLLVMGAGDIDRLLNPLADCLINE